jgi:predicted small secreted protein
MEEKKDRAMSRKIILVVTTARNTVRGLEQDLESVANDVDEAT